MNSPANATAASAATPGVKQVLCMKWGTRYGVDYVNKLYSMVRRNTTGELNFVCLTDDAAGMHPAISVRPCPEVSATSPWRNSSWRKMTLWQREVFDLTGTFLFLDLDIVVVNNIDDLFTYGDGFCVMRNWTQPKLRVGNTSVFRFDIGSHPHLWDEVAKRGDELKTQYRTDQMFISMNIDKMTFFPDEWCRLFKVHCVPGMPMRWLREPMYPKGAKIVAFPGQPNPPDAAIGHWPAPWHKKLYKHIRPARWVAEHWR